MSTPIPFVNYYEILGMPRTAEQSALEQKIKEESRTWRKRQASPDLRKRQEAELRVEHLSQAREILLDPVRRQAFDQALAARPAPQANTEQSANGKDWLALTEEYLARNDYHSATYAAREATQANGDSALAWNLRARANGGLGNLNDAAYEARQAADIEPNNPQYQFDLGSMLEQGGRWGDARGAYERAARLDPSTFLYPLAIAGILLQTGSPAQALPLIEPIHQAHPGEEIVNYYLASCLHDLAEEVPKARQGASYWITSPDEITTMESLLRRASQLRHNDPGLAQALTTVSTYVEDCKRSKFAPPLGCGAMVFLTFLTVVFVFGGFGAIGSGSAGGGIVLLLLGIGLAIALVRATWKPVWKINRTLHPITG
jgi:tetratricopeptide (TPR) repeat protein